MTKFLVIGDGCTDLFIYGSSPRLSPEAPVPVFIPKHEEKAMGMAHNVYKNLESIVNTNYNSGFTPYLLNPIIDINNVIKTRYVDEATNHYFLRVDTGHHTIFSLNDSYRKMIREADCIIISDYDKGYLSHAMIEEICDLRTNAIVFLDTKKLITSDILERIDFIKLNFSEWENLSFWMRENIVKYMDKIIITKGGEGATFLNKLYPTNKIVTMDVSGAGDTFLAALAYMYMKTSLMNESIPFANEMATKVVQKRGVAIV